MTVRTWVTIRAPAKLNLGLEVVGRRPDGYHDLVTIFQAVSVFDDVTLTPAPDLDVASDDPGLAGPDNLAFGALVALRTRLGTSQGASVRLTKRIPVAAGLGGASSDAAATLLGARRLWDAAVADEDLAELAAALGSDVPFFLRGGTVLATGRGERLEPLPPPAVWFVVVTPAVALPRKTATLYAALTPADLSDGRDVRRQARRLRAGEPLAPDLLRNAFTRPLAALRPGLAELPTVMRRHGAPVVALSGAGPSHYAVVDDPEGAARLATTLAEVFGEAARVVACEPVANPPRPVATYLGASPPRN